MLTLRRIQRDYTQAGSLNRLIALWGFVDDEIFLTKAGHLGVVYRLAGVDYECRDHAQRREVVHQYEAALRCLDESCRVYQYLSRRTMPAIVPAPCRQPVAQEVVQRRAAYLNDRRSELYELDLHLVLIYEGLQPRTSSSRDVRRWGPTSSVVMGEIKANNTLAGQGAPEVHAQLHRSVRRSASGGGDR